MVRSAENNLKNMYDYLGNKEIMKEYKVGFLCSRKVPADKILKCYDWAIEQREKGICVVSGFHSKIEKDVFHYLSKGKQPIIIVLARTMYNRIPNELKSLLADNRLLLISPFAETNRISKETSLKRNQLILDICDEMVIGHKSEGGMIEQLLHNLEANKTMRLIV